MIESNHFPVERSNGKTYAVAEGGRVGGQRGAAPLDADQRRAERARLRDAEKKTGLDLVDLGAGSEDVRINYADLQAQPRRYNTSPLWSGLMNDGRAYAAYTYNVEKLVPWRTLTGRQHFYLDHEMYLAYGENLPTYKPSPKPEAYGDLKQTLKDGGCEGPQLPDAARQVAHPLHVHGQPPDADAVARLRAVLAERGRRRGAGHQGQRLGRGLQRPRRVLHPRRQRAHPEGRVHRLPRARAHGRHPKSQVRGGKRAGGHNSFTRIHLKPNFLAGGYGQFTYHFNYWGPIAPNRDTHVIVKRMDKVVF